VSVFLSWYRWLNMSKEVFLADEVEHVFIFTHIVIVLYWFEDGLCWKRTRLQRSMVCKHDVSSRYYTQRQVVVSALTLYWKLSLVRTWLRSTLLSQVCLVGISSICWDRILKQSTHTQLIWATGLIKVEINII